MISSPSCPTGSSDGEVRRKHKSRSKEKHKHKSSKSAKSSKSKKDKKDKKEKSKKDKYRRDRAPKRTREDDSSPEARPERLEFGSYGILRESDYPAKRPEFAAWASEVKRIDIESLPRYECSSFIVPGSGSSAGQEQVGIVAGF